jgi:hypothetical protein
MEKNCWSIKWGSVVEGKGRNAKTKKRNEIKHEILVEKLYGKRPSS